MSFKIPCGGFKLDEKSFSLDKNDVLSIPKPLTYDYMPEGYPKKDGWSVEWDGNPEGKLYIPIEEDYGLYKISDIVLSVEDLLGATITFPDRPGETAVITSDSIGAITDDIIVTNHDLVSIAIVRKDNADVQGITIPEKGVYAFDDNNKFKMFKENITPMSADFMPKNFNVVFRATTGNVPTSCNVTYGELRGWLESNIPVLAVLNIGNPVNDVLVLGYIGIGSSSLTFKENHGASASFKYNSDGTFSRGSSS